MPMTSQEMIKLLLKNGFAIISQNGSHVKLKNTDTHKTVIVPYQRHKKRSGTGNSETSWLKITNIDKENQNEKTFLSGTFS